MKLKNDDICPEDLLQVILTADKIPDRATVTKVKGDVRYTFRRSVVVYPIKGKDAKPVVIAGFFLTQDGGDLNQVRANQRLCWVVTAQDFIDLVQQSWEAPPQ